MGFNSSKTTAGSGIDLSVVLTVILSLKHDSIVV